MSSMSYFRICSMRSIQKTTFCGFIALLNKVLDFGGQLVNKLSFILAIILLPLPLIYPILLMAKLRQFSHFLQQWVLSRILPIFKNPTASRELQVYFRSFINIISITRINRKPSNMTGKVTE